MDKMAWLSERPSLNKSRCFRISKIIPLLLNNALILYLEDFSAVKNSFRVEDYAEDAKSVECGVKMHSEYKFSGFFTNTVCCRSMTATVR